MNNVLTDIRSLSSTLSSLAYADLLEHCQRSARTKRSTDDIKRLLFESSTGFGEVPYIIPKFFLCFGLPSLICHLAGSVFLLLQYKLVHPWRQLGKKREANVWGKLGGTKRGLDVEMSPWKSGDAVSKEYHHAILATPINATTIKGTVHQPNKLRSYAQFCLHMATRGQNRNLQI